jgi:hypothetical protein
MKKIFSLIMALVLIAAFASVSFAASAGNAVQGIYSAASGATTYSSAMDVRKAKTKSFQPAGITLGSNASDITYKNMSGIASVECGPTSSGPWVACGRWQDGTGTAVSSTTNSFQSWQDPAAYIRLKWVAGTVGGKLKAWFNWIIE